MADDAAATDAPGDANDASAWDCPACGTRIDLAAATPDDVGVIQCPGCGAAYSLNAQDDGATSSAEAAHGDAEGLEYAAPATPADRRGDFAQELDGLRIRQVSALRRGASRGRSYLIIGVIISLVASVKLVLMTIGYVRAAGWGMRPLGYLMFVVVLLMLAGYFARRAMELHRELQTPAPLPPVEGEPDFTTLSNGSHYWKNLEDIR